MKPSHLILPKFEELSCKNKITALEGVKYNPKPSNKAVGCLPFQYND